MRIMVILYREIGEKASGGGREQTTGEAAIGTSDQIERRE
jgi:hypothetical protein